jgi:hypothetical protein
MSKSVINPIWSKGERRRLSLALFSEALRLEREIKLAITTSTPAGRAYRSGRLTSGAKKFAGQGLRTYKTAKGNSRFIIGSKFHRASARDQAPAVRAGGLLNANRAQKLGELKFRVINSKKYAGVLDSPQGLNRPFFNSVVNRFRPGYFRRLQIVINNFK